MLKVGLIWEPIVSVAVNVDSSLNAEILKHTQQVSQQIFLE